MVNCSDCRFWEAETAVLGFCDKVDRSPEFEIIAHVSDDTGLSVRLQTSYNFGCNLHELPTSREPNSDDIDGE